MPVISHHEEMILRNDYGAENIPSTHLVRIARHGIGLIHKRFVQVNSGIFAFDNVTPYSDHPFEPRLVFGAFEDYEIPTLRNLCPVITHVCN